MKDVKMRNLSLGYVLALMLLALSLGVFVTSYLTPSYAADPSTFFSCEVAGGGCSIRLNTTSHIILNSTGTLHYPTNGTYSSGSGLNMTLGFLSFETHQFRNFQVGAVHSVVYEDTNRDGEARLMLLGGTIAAPQTTTLHFMPRFNDAANFETLSISGNGTEYRIDVMQAGTGLARPLIIEMDGVDILTFESDKDVNFNSNDVFNLGNAGNDFLAASNTLIATTFSGTVDGGNNAFNNLGAAGNDLGVTNTLVATDFNANAVTNLGNAGNDFSGSPNTLIATTFSGTLDMNSNNFINVASVTGDGSANLAVFSGGTNTLLLRTRGPAGDPIAYTRMTFSSDVGTGTITMQNANFAVPSNNTLSMFSDAVRVANIFSVVNTAKSQVTGLLLESDITPKIGEIFVNGDIVCIDKGFSFTKCIKNNDTLVLGPVYLLPERNITRYDNVSYLDKGLTKYKLEAIWEDVNHKPMLVIEGPLNVKACGIITKGQFLVAGAGGCAKGVDELTPTLRYFGIAVANSNAGYVEAYMP